MSIPSSAWRSRLADRVLGQALADQEQVVEVAALLVAEPPELVQPFGHRLEAVGQQGVALGRHGPAVAPAGGPAQGGVAVAAHDDRDGVALARRLRPEAGLDVGVEAAVVGGHRVGPGVAHQGDVLVEAGEAALHGHVHRVELLGHPPGAHPQDHATAGDGVDGGQLLGQHHGMAVGGDEHPGAEADGRGAPGHRAHDRHRVGEGQLRRSSGTSRRRCTGTSTRGWSGVNRWSNSHTESNPAASAACATRTSPAPSGTRPALGRCSPNFTAHPS